MKQKNFIISIEQARLLALQSQGLNHFSLDKGKVGALATIEHLGYIQIDTLAVAARAHHHTLWSRVPNYKEQILTELLEKDKTIFEYWSHAASYLPMSEYRFTLPQKKNFSDGKSHWFEQDKKLKKYVLDRIKSEGSLQSKDFEHKGSGPGNWYEWKPAKKALEQLFMEGKLMVASRKGFQKVYDLAERVLPNHVNDNFPTDKEFSKHLILKAVHSHGLVEEKEITYLRNGLKESTSKVLRSLLKSGEVVEVNLEGNILIPFFTTPEIFKSIEKLEIKKKIHILSPFDNLIIQRKRLQRIFGFDYMIECYLPEAKRKFGYFCLPILYGDKFVGRFDPKADRNSKIFHIKSMYFEKEFKPNEEFNQKFSEIVKAYANFNGCNNVVAEIADAKWKRGMMKLI